MYFKSMVADATIPASDSHIQLIYPHFTLPTKGAHGFNIDRTSNMERYGPDVASFPLQKPQTVQEVTGIGVCLAVLLFFVLPFMILHH